LANDTQDLLRLGNFIASSHIAAQEEACVEAIFTEAVYKLKTLIAEETLCL
jgi:hypothetical protein